MSKLNKSLFSSEDQTWETPIDFFNKLNDVFKFTLDVCAVPQTAKCKKFFTPEINGLMQEWPGVCWVNPPYGRDQIKWINKAKEESNKNNSVIVCLIPARPDTKVWQDIIFKNANIVCFIKGRLKFGNSKVAAPFPSALVIFGNKINEQQENTLNTLGKVFKIT